MNRLFDTSVNVGLRQFYVLGAAGSIGNLFGFVGNVYIYGLSAPTIFCALCTLVIFGMTFWGIRSRHVKRAAYVIITLITFFEFPILYYIYQTGTIVYMVLAMVAIATFLPTTAAVIFGCLAFLVDMSAVILAYYHPVDVELVTAESELNSMICSLMIVLFSVFTITIILNVQQKKQAEELTSLSRQLEQAADHDALTGLYNRRYLNRYLERLAQKGITGPRRPMNMTRITMIFPAAGSVGVSDRVSPTVATAETISYRQSSRGLPVTEIRSTVAVNAIVSAKKKITTAVRMFSSMTFRPQTTVSESPRM